jgi:hypothetical protein
MRTIGLFALLAVLLTTSGCRSAYYSAWETFGKHKRDLLRDNVERARDDQEAAAEQFKDALTRLQELYAFEGGDLEKTYRQLQNEYNRSASRAETVRTRLARVEQIAADLFREWEAEIKTITNPRLRDDSRRQLQETQRRFATLNASMRRAEQSMEPVLTQFRDQVTYLKHNLNAQAIGALRGEAIDIEREVQQLLREMNAAIAQADAFIQTMREP